MDQTVCTSPSTTDVYHKALRALRLGCHFDQGKAKKTWLLKLSEQTFNNFKSCHIMFIAMGKFTSHGNYSYVETRKHRWRLQFVSKSGLKSVPNKWKK